jgi:hypothetical protein
MQARLFSATPATSVLTKTPRLLDDRQDRGRRRRDGDRPEQQAYVPGNVRQREEEQDHDRRREHRLEDEQVDEPALRVGQPAEIEVAADRDGHQAEREIHEGPELVDRLRAEEVDDGGPEQDADTYLPGDAGEVEAAAQGPRGDARHERDRDGQQRIRPRQERCVAQDGQHRPAIVAGVTVTIRPDRAGAVVRGIWWRGSAVTPGSVVFT